MTAINLADASILTRTYLQPRYIIPNKAAVTGRLLKMGRATDLVEQSAHETLTYYAFPDIHWHKIRTNNPLERIMREIRRRTRVVIAFPDGQS